MWRFVGFWLEMEDDGEGEGRRRRIQYRRMRGCCVVILGVRP